MSGAKPRRIAAPIEFTAATISGVARKLPLRRITSASVSGSACEAIALAAEDVHVGVAKAVDRLELVADEEELVSAPRSSPTSSSCRRFVSWNSSTIRCRKRPR